MDLFTSFCKLTVEVAFRCHGADDVDVEDVPEQVLQVVDDAVFVFVAFVLGGFARRHCCRNKCGN